MLEGGEGGEGQRRMLEEGGGIHGVVSGGILAG